MFRNLEAELKRKGITRAELAAALGINIATVSEKLTKPKRIKLCEAIQIKDTFFQDMSIEYLFETTETTAA